MVRAAFLTIMASFSLSSWPASSSCSMLRESSSRATIPVRAAAAAAAATSTSSRSTGGSSDHAMRLRGVAFGTSTMSVLRTGCRSSDAVLGSATTLRNMCSSSSAPGSGPRQGSCKVTEDMEGSVGGEGGGLLSVIAERGNIEARERAEKLLDLIRASPRGSTGLSAQAREAAVAAAQDEDASQGAALPTVFFGSGNSRDGVIEVELLKVGEKPGQGLQSELPEVLRHQCVPGTLSGDVLVRACAGKKKPGGRTSLAVVDCTAGYLHDSLRLAAAGHRVTAIERDPVVFSFSSACLSMLQHSHNTSKMFEERVASGGGELSLLCADSAAWLSARADESAAFDIVYLDPMFPPKRRQSALPKRRMQWLREHLHTGGGDGEKEKVELEQLLSLARRVGKKVVIKRADDGPRIGKPSSSIESGKLVRYDIYVGIGLPFP